eukprot:157059-Prymnesium_polylepis.1
MHLQGARSEKKKKKKIQDLPGFEDAAVDYCRKQVETRALKLSKETMIEVLNDFNSPVDPKASAESMAEDIANEVLHETDPEDEDE